MQEALTNTVKHAAATEVGVLLTYGESGLTVSVTDDDRGEGPGTATGSGHGPVAGTTSCTRYGWSRRATRCWRPRWPGG